MLSILGRAEGHHDVRSAHIRRIARFWYQLKRTGAIPRGIAPAST